METTQRRQLTDNAWDYQTTTKRPTQFRGMQLVLHWALDGAGPLSEPHLNRPGRETLSRLADTYLTEYVPRISENAGLPLGLVPIHWTVDATGPWVDTDQEWTEHFASAPLQENPVTGEPLNVGTDWLSGYTWPVNTFTGKRLNWLRLPVQDLRWTDRRRDRGGFIQTMLGEWRPSPLQTVADIYKLAAAAGLQPPRPPGRLLCTSGRVPATTRHRSH